MEKSDANPMMKIMLDQMKAQLADAFPGGWDGLKALINDADKWAEMMGGLMDVMKNLSEDDLNMMMSQISAMGGMGGGAGMGGAGMGGGGGMPPGMGGFGGANSFGDTLGDTAGTLAGLDDLSEGED